MMCRLCFCIMFLLLSISSMLAQQKEDGKKDADLFKRGVVVKNYRALMKASNYTKANSEIDAALKQYEAARKDPSLYKLKVDALTGMIDAENRKIYLNQKPDTAKYFSCMYELYEAALACDSTEQLELAQMEAEGKKSGSKYRKVLGPAMLTYRKKILNAGKFHYNKKEYGKAYSFFDMYAKTKTAPVFETKDGGTLVDDPDDMTDVAGLAVLSAYASGNNQGVLHYLDESLNDKEKRSKFVELGSRSAAELGDTAKMVTLLEKGFHSYPSIDYFFITLSKYYNEHEEYEKALDIALAKVKYHPNNRDYWFIAGKGQLLLNKYADALVSFKKCVEIKADDAESYSSIGGIYLHDAHELYSKLEVKVTDPTYASKKAEINELYKHACEAYEKARSYNENDTELWLSGLRESYFKLNRGKSLKALEKYK